jgi:Mor family transcriptional regulator
MKLSYEDKESIYKRYKHGGDFESIAKDYNVSVKKIKRIIENIMNAYRAGDKKVKLK